MQQLLYIEKLLNEECKGIEAVEEDMNIIRGEELEELKYSIRLEKLCSMKRIKIDKAPRSG